MQTGYIKIIREEGKAPMIEAELVNNTLWLSKHQIARFFDVFEAKIEMNLRSIFKNNLLSERNVTCSYRFTDKGIEKERIYYNLEVLIFLSYRIATEEAQIFRQFLNSALRKHLQRKEVEKFSKLIWYFDKNQNYWLN